ncbi:ComF family protein [Flavobacterium antarcticum]|uniref:ComF family protein n=1 Tax=Flavobacterium antarcticum TaxID=271155 RepID=UPI0003B2E448|nr:phosphoribosyltransferase family protein [Flavobacterium antarcticum]
MINSLFNLFFPPACLGCEKFLLANEAVICTQCRHDLPLTNQHLNLENEAMTKFYGRLPIEHVSSLMYFHKKGIAQELIHNLKYRGHQEVGTLIGNWYGTELQNCETLRSIDAIIPIPLHKRKFKKRGYNQVTTFGEALSKQLNCPFDNSILKRLQHSKTQTFKNLMGRNEIKSHTFQSYFTTEHHNKHFLLIDDVMTTGATLEAAGKALLEIPGIKISIVCMAMSQS